MKLYSSQEDSTMPRMLFTHQVVECFNLTMRDLRALKIRPMRELGRKRCVKYDASLIEKRLNELSGLSTDKSNDSEIERLLIERAQRISL